MRLGPILIPASLCLPLLLTGCALKPTASPMPEPAVKLTGSVHGGQQPIVGAHVYLFAANTTGYGQPSVSLLNAASTGTLDSLGAYVVTDDNGAFTITGDYSCTPNTQVYLYALGGNPGAGVNSAAALLAALGNCPSSGSFLASIPFIQVNEVTTIAAAYAFAGFATDATHVSSPGTPLAQTGIANAFANATNLVDVSTGAALSTTPAGNGTPPQAKINALANILASCINSTGPSSTTCSTLLINTLSGGPTGITPTDTATAAINIAHNPGSNIANLFALSTATPPFAPATGFLPTDFTLQIAFNVVYEPKAIAIDASGDVWITSQYWNTVSKLSSLGVLLSPGNGFTSPDMKGPESIAIDSLGNAWIANYSTSSSVTKLSPSGTVLSGSSGFTGNGLSYGIAIDGSDNVWLTNYASPGGVTELSNAGAVLSPAGGFTGGGINGSFGIAIDAAGNAWVSNNAGNTLSELSNNGSPISPATGYTGGGIQYPSQIAVDASGNIWNTNSGSVSELSSSGTPISPASGYPIPSPSPYISLTGLAIDGSGNAWVGEYAVNHQLPAIIEYSPSGSMISPSVGYNYGGSSVGSIAVDGSGNVWAPTCCFGTSTVIELVGAATPVVTPLSVAAKNNSIASRP